MAKERTDAQELFGNIAKDYESITGGSTRAIARQLIQLAHLQGITAPTAVVHDNACGTGAVSVELLQASQDPPQIIATDAVAMMVEATISCVKSLGPQERMQVKQMPGEKLDIPDNTFTHSITNFGIMFFQDSKAGAKEIYRTLKPGGVAAITAPERATHFRWILNPTLRDTRPQDEPLAQITDNKWEDPVYLEQQFRDAGFSDVQILPRNVVYGGKNYDAIADQLFSMVTKVHQGKWSEEDYKAYRQNMMKHVEAVCTPQTLLDGTEGVGFWNQAMIAICRK